jgi:hypothetical protein
VLMNVEGSSISELTTTFWQMAFEQLPPAVIGGQQQVVAVTGPDQEAGARRAR